MRKGIRGHGFTRSEIEGPVLGAIAESPFREANVAETGSTFRIAMRKLDAEAS
jgi:hypothetical protein